MAERVTPWSRPNREPRHTRWCSLRRRRERVAAKAIIDLMAAAPTLEAIMGREATMATLGYQRYETGMPNRLFYYRDRDGRRTHQLHVVTTET
ncbi:GrpB family protein [Rugosimonospora africana]|uniref:Uncharacterized protein n=1 Tax=Rugosimonospora africana TaxID=556532 RepID=A0A8J3QSR3_9ACTN|nr:GrpB family protein [Rugosimonospora africana]GIH15322.1 hypothetical protein Raf01_34940 [Rugosimonospora africana]